VTVVEQVSPDSASSCFRISCIKTLSETAIWIVGRAKSRFPRLSEGLRTRGTEWTAWTETSRAQGRCVRIDPAKRAWDRRHLSPGPVNRGVAPSYRPRFPSSEVSPHTPCSRPQPRSVLKTAQIVLATSRRPSPPSTRCYILTANSKQPRALLKRSCRPGRPVVQGGSPCNEITRPSFWV
jgi:hypothetical protein